MSTERGRRSGGRGTGRQLGVFWEDNVILVLDPGANGGVGRDARVKEEPGEESGVSSIVFSHVLHIQEINLRVETGEVKRVILGPILSVQAGQCNILIPSQRISGKVR